MALQTDRAPWAQGGGGARVLVEATEWADRESIATLLGAAGFQIASCAGPQGAGERCPLAAHLGCTIAETADVIVHMMRPTDARNREVLRALRTKLPHTPVVVEVPRPTYERCPQDYAGFTVLHPPITVDELVDAVQQALRP